MRQILCLINKYLSESERIARGKSDPQHPVTHQCLSQGQSKHGEE